MTLQRTARSSSQRIGGIDEYLECGALGRRDCRAGVQRPTPHPVIGSVPARPCSADETVRSGSVCQTYGQAPCIFRHAQRIPSSAIRHGHDPYRRFGVTILEASRVRVTIPNTPPLPVADIGRCKRLRLKTGRRRVTEIAVRVMNHMLELGRPYYVRMF